MNLLSNWKKKKKVWMSFQVLHLSVSALFISLYPSLSAVYCLNRFFIHLNARTTITFVHISDKKCLTCSVQKLQKSSKLMSLLHHVAIAGASMLLK